MKVSLVKITQILRRYLSLAIGQYYNFHPTPKIAMSVCPLNF